MGMFDFISGTKRAVAISFGDDAIRVASLAANRKRVDIVYFAEQLLPEGAVERSVIVNAGLFQEALRALKRSCKITEPVHLVVPEDRTISFTTRVVLDRTVAMQTLIEDHLKAYVLLNHEDIPTEDSVCEYEVTQVSDNVVSVSAVVMRKSVLRSYIELCSEVGITIATCNAPAYVFAKHHAPAQNGHASVVVSLQEEGAVVVVSHAGKVQESQYLPIGGKDLVRIIRDYAVMERSGAEAALEKHGMLATHPDARVYQKLHETLLPVAKTAEQMVVDYLQRISERQTVDLYVIGAYATLPGIEEFFGRTTRLPAHRATPHHIVAGSASNDGVPVIHMRDFLKFAPVIFTAYEYVQTLAFKY